MPKVKSLNPYDEQNRILLGNIARLKAMNTVRVGDFYELIGMGKDTYYRRLKRPEEFTLKELRAMSERFKISLNDLLGI